MRSNTAESPDPNLYEYPGAFSDNTLLSPSGSPIMLEQGGQQRLWYVSSSPMDANKRIKVKIIDNSPPGWVANVFEKIGQLLSLEENWDSYGAKPVDLKAAERVIKILAQVMSDDTPEPSIVPGNSGEIQIEWHTNGIDLEVEVEPSGTVSISYDDLTEATPSYDDEINEGIEFSLGVISEYVSIITQRSQDI